MDNIIDSVILGNSGTNDNSVVSESDDNWGSLYKKTIVPGFEIKEKYNLRFLVTNIRGFMSKKEILEKQVEDLSVDVIAISESHTSNEIAPTINGFSSFFRNRKVRMKGGVALLIRNTIAVDVVEIFSGTGENEILGVKIGKVDPPCVIMCCYGTQSNSFGPDVVAQHVKEMFGEMDQYLKGGAQCLLLGDYNLALGREHIPGNDMFLSVPGKIFNERITDYNLKIMNNLSADPTTHQDPRSKMKRALDLVIVNHPERVSKFKIDKEDKFTPFSVKYKNGEYSKTNADHQAILFDYVLGVNCELLREVKKPQMWQFNVDGDIAFEHLTDLGYDHVIGLANLCDDVNTMERKLMAFITKCKFKSYKIKTYTKDHLNDFMAEEVWRYRLEQIEKLEKEVENETDINKIFKTKIYIENQNKANNMTALKDDSGNLLSDIDDLFNFILDYNVKNMEKIEGSLSVEMIQKLKEEIVMDALDGRSNCPQEIPWDVFMKVTEKVLRQHKEVMRDFNKSGARFKLAIFSIINSIYKEEVFPESFLETYKNL